MGAGQLLGELGAIILACTPLGLSLWALLDAARRPAWAWGLARKNRPLWMGGILLGILSVIGGVIVSGWYLLRVRPAVAAAEEGRISPG